MTESNPCSVTTCDNGGLCLPLVVPAETPACLCAAGYSGPSCSVLATSCSSSPCLHSASCQEEPTSGLLVLLNLNSQVMFLIFVGGGGAIQRAKITVVVIFYNNLNPMNNMYFFKATLATAPEAATRGPTARRSSTTAPSAFARTRASAWTSPAASFATASRASPAQPAPLG